MKDVMNIVHVGLSIAGNDVHGRFRGPVPPKRKLYEYQSPNVKGEIFAKSYADAKRKLRAMYPDEEI